MVDFVGALLPGLSVIIPVVVMVVLLVVNLCLLVDGVWVTWCYWFGGVRVGLLKEQHMLLMKDIIREWNEEERDTDFGVDRFIRDMEEYAQEDSNL